MAKGNSERGATGADDNDEAAEKKSKKIELSGAQVTGGALASVTAAFLGSYLGVAGTVFGAGLTSVVITVGGALYQRSLETTKEKLETTKDKPNVLAARAALKRATKVTLQAPPPPRPRERAITGTTPPRAPAEEATRKIQVPGAMQWPGGEQVEHDPDATRRMDTGAAEAEARTRMLAWNDAANKDDATRQVEAVEERVTEPAPRVGRGIRWGVVAVTSALMFGLGMLVITGFEGVLGKPLSGGDRGTTIGRVLTPAAKQGEQARAPQQEESAEPSSTRRSEPSTSTSSEPSGGEQTAPGEPGESGQSDATEPTRETGGSEAPATGETTGAEQPQESGADVPGGEIGQRERVDAP
ncbi:hypothetical protein GCM10027271_06610 [Saccharopolyspora gloriosae]|uniref:Uncharacterized protein n=1 Tax=Saccharopolyspora gloriosae TaxID=455344 RepID=A0A840NVP7_9PSEU|nr:hypothetical protein [Saccharopolyspora gloriosae]MBB5072207.1 hypothetical protein [Saccharopolyspora gloriosae]